MLYTWWRKKNPGAKTIIRNPANTPNVIKQMEEAWRAWDRLEKERKMAQHSSAIEVEDWWVEKDPEKMLQSAEVGKNDGSISNLPIKEER